MSAIADSTTKTIRQLDQKAGSSESVSEDDVQDFGKLSRVLTRILRELAPVRRRFVPRRIDFQDRKVAGSGALESFPHGFNGRVRWWVVDSTGDVPELVRDVATDDNTLVLVSDMACTLTLRVEEVG